LGAGEYIGMRRAALLLRRECARLTGMIAAGVTHFGIQSNGEVEWSGYESAAGLRELLDCFWNRLRQSMDSKIGFKKGLRQVQLQIRYAGLYALS
jgi:hypothetical protein